MRPFLKSQRARKGRFFLSNRVEPPLPGRKDSGRLIRIGSDSSADDGSASSGDAAVDGLRVVRKREADSRRRVDLRVELQVPMRRAGFEEHDRGDAGRGRPKCRALPSRHAAAPNVDGARAEVFGEENASVDLGLDDSSQRRDNLLIRPAACRSQQTIGFEDLPRRRLVDVLRQVATGAEFAEHGQGLTPRRSGATGDVERFVGGGAVPFLNNRDFAGDGRRHFHVADLTALARKSGSAYGRGGHDDGRHEAQQERAKPRAGVGRRLGSFVAHGHRQRVNRGISNLSCRQLLCA